jgi:hypothetical protein
MDLLKRDLIIFSYAFRKKGEHKWHEVFNEAEGLLEMLKPLCKVLPVHHNSRFDLLRITIILALRRCIGRETIIIGQGMVYRKLETYCNYRVLLITENPKELALKYELEAKSTYSQLLESQVGALRNWGEYFSQSNINRADLRIVYGDFNYDIYKSPKILWWQDVRPYTKFNFVPASKNIGYILSSGYIIKGLHRLLELAKEHNDYEFHIFGNTNSIIENSILNEYSNISFHGYVDFYNAGAQIDFRCFILPYLLEGCSASALALVRSNMPLLTTEASGIGFLLTNKRIVSFKRNSDFKSILNQPLGYLENNLSLETKLPYNKLKDAIDYNLHKRQ